MEKILGLAAAVVILAFTAPILGVLFGAFSGWVVGLFFTDAILSFLTRVGVDTYDLAVWEVGAAMGFLGGFLKTKVIGKD